MTHVATYRFAKLVSLTMIMAIVGCTQGAGVTTSAVGPRVKVIYEGSPLADVQVSVYVDRTAAKPILQGITNAEGIAVLLPIDDGTSPGTSPGTTGAETSLPVTLQSLGDGGWMLDAKLAELARGQLTLRISPSDPPPMIEIPRGGVKPL